MEEGFDPELTVHENRRNQLKARLVRLEERRYSGASAAFHVSVDYDLLEDLVQDSEDLQRLVKVHPELEREVMSRG